MPFMPVEIMPFEIMPFEIVWFTTIFMICPGLITYPLELIATPTAWLFDLWWYDREVISLYYQYGPFAKPANGSLGFFKERWFNCYPRPNHPTPFPEGMRLTRVFHWEFDLGYPYTRNTLMDETIDEYRLLWAIQEIYHLNLTQYCWACDPHQANYIFSDIHGGYGLYTQSESDTLLGMLDNASPKEVRKLRARASLRGNPELVQVGIDRVKSMESYIRQYYLYIGQYLPHHTAPIPSETWSGLISPDNVCLRLYRTHCNLYGQQNILWEGMYPNGYPVEGFKAEFVSSLTECDLADFNDESLLAYRTHCNLYARSPINCFSREAIIWRGIYADGYPVGGFRAR